MCQKPSVVKNHRGDEKDGNDSKTDEDCLSSSSIGSTSTAATTMNHHVGHRQHHHQSRNNDAMVLHRVLSILLFLVVVLALAVVATDNTKGEASLAMFVSTADQVSLPKHLSTSSSSKFPFPAFLERMLRRPSSASSISTTGIGDATSPTSSPSSPDNIVTTKQRGRIVHGKDPSKNVKDLYAAYKDIQQEYYDRAYNPSNRDQWKLLTDYDGAKVSMMEVPEDPTCPYVKMTAVIPVSVDKCWEFLKLSNWHKSMPKMDPFYENVKIYGDYNYKGVNMILAKKQTKRILAFGKRDFVFLSVIDTPLDDGTWISGTVSIHIPELIPRNTPTYTRAYQDSIAFYKPIDGGRKTHITIVCRIDLNDSTPIDEGGTGGFIPMWLYVKTIGATGNKSVRNMRDVLIEEAKHHQSEEEQEEEEEVHDPIAVKKRIRYPFFGSKRKSSNRTHHGQ